MLHHSCVRVHLHPASHLWGTAPDLGLLTNSQDHRCFSLHQSCTAVTGLHGVSHCFQTRFTLFCGASTHAGHVSLVQPCAGSWEMGLVSHHDAHLSQGTDPTVFPNVLAMKQELESYYSASLTIFSCRCLLIIAT